MVFRGGKVFIGDRFEEMEVRVKDGRISALGKETGENADDSTEEILDLKGNYLLPGMIDLHTHGCMGYDFSTATEEEIDVMCGFYFSRGITSVAATTMTMGYEDYKKAAATIGNYIREKENHNLIGINMEGPFISKEKKGAHDEQYITGVSQEKLEELNRLSGGKFLIVDVAPELPGAIPFIKENSGKFILSIAHTKADYEKAMEAFHAGATQVTHLFNAMEGLGHRQPGVPGAAFEAGANVEMICDGIHIHPTVMKMIFQLMGKQVLVISDSMSAAGLEDGEYILGGQQVFVKDGRAALADGTIAGSTTDMLKELNVLLDKCALSLEEIIPCLTSHPARAIGMEDRIGSIAVGKAADLLILDADRKVKAVYKNGIRVV